MVKTLFFDLSATLPEFPRAEVQKRTLRTVVIDPAVPEWLPAINGERRRLLEEGKLTRPGASACVIRKLPRFCEPGEVFVCG